MTYNSIFNINPNEKKQMILCPNVDEYQIPATVIRGKDEGITLVITAGIHSGEYPGVAAATRIAKQIDPGNIKGRLICIHNVNTSGFWGKSSDLVPEDGSNLNANYPGKADGTVGERIADYFVKEVFPHADFLVDLHSGGQMEPLTPCLFFPDKAVENVREVSLAAAKATNIPYLIASSATTGEYSYAAMSMNIPALLLERGHSNYCHEQWIEDYCTDIYLLMEHFGMIKECEKRNPLKKTIFNRTIYLTSEESGMWYPNIRENETVKKGELLGHMEDIWGNTIKEYYAQDDGLVFYYTSGLAVNKGNPLAAYGILNETENV